VTLEEDLAAWVAGRSDWQKDAVARFCRNESLSDADVTAIADQLIAGTYPSTIAISAKDVPGTSENGDPVTLDSVSDVTGVNALLPGQHLTFGSTGLTIIYGDNASGKSGYARLIRQAVTARIKADLLGDVFAKEHHDQSATFEYRVGDRQISWNLGDTSNHDLSSIRFYDEECGEAYVTLSSEISFRPSALTLLDRLSGACDLIQQELARRLTQNDEQRPGMPLLAEGTKANAFLSSLTASTTQEQIDEATALAADYDTVLSAKLQEAARLQGSDPNKEKARLSKLAAHWNTVKVHVDRMANALNAHALGRIEDARKRAGELRGAAKIASAKNFDAEPLNGIGSATWRALWEAARQYSVAEAYHDHAFPVVDEGSMCVLCQQPLSQEGVDRLTGFEDFIKDTTSLNADTAERQLSALRTQVVELVTPPVLVTSALSHLQAGGQDVSGTESWIAAAATVADEAIEWIDGARTVLPTEPPTSPSAGIEEGRQTLLAASATIDATTFNDQLRDLQREVAELQARAQLSGAKQNLAVEVERLKARGKIEDAKRLADTTGITRKSTALTTEHVTSVVRDQFTRETERLHLRKVTLDPTGGRRDATLEHRPKLLGATVNADIDHVLSEGEQTALGLAGFLTEVEFDDSKSGIVLDDPVSSLDAGRRSRVAKRLIGLAQDRQVIVFTHEVTFVTALNKTARDLGVEVTERTILCKGDRPGLASDKHPWNVKDIPSRIDWLAAELTRLQNDRGQLDSDEYTRRAQEWGGRLSQAWERAVNLDVVNELVDRGTNEVRPRKFRMLARITEQDDSDYQAGYSKASEWAPRHDQAPETNFIAPEPDELEAELIRFTDWVTRIKGYKK
jgi:energy-coupling factor transporter ATP-binding protein EcfA2